MDERKALFRSRMRQAAERKEKRIDSPLVRYNDLGQPVCKVCNVSIKTESLWGAHLASRQHKEAVEELKERVKRRNLTTSNVAEAPETATAEESKDETENKRSQDVPAGGQAVAVRGDTKQDNEAASKDASGALPQGFFDSKVDDMKARGVQPPKVDLQEELKEFHKVIEDDLKAMDERFAEDEALEADIRTEEEEFEQMFCMDRVETLKKRKLELEEKMQKTSTKRVREDTDKLLDELPSEDDSDEEILDWRSRKL